MMSVGDCGINLLNNHIIYVVRHVKTAISVKGNIR